MKEYRQTATASEERERADIWLARVLPGFSRSRVQSLIRDGRVTSNGHPVKAGHRLRAGEEMIVAIPPPAPSGIVPEDIPLTILYEDDDLVVLNKQAGLVVHPSAGHPDGTLVNALVRHCGSLPGIGGEMRPGIVHRLDKNTSGLMVAAKTDLAMDGLARQFREREVFKQYTAIVVGVPDPPEGVMTGNIGRSARNPGRMWVRGETGRDAVTRYEVVEDLGGISTVKVRLETGRTHQIRVHFAAMKHPVVGDTEYGWTRERVELPVEPNRQMLHAARLRFAHPRSGRKMEFRTALPADMAELVEAMREVGRRC